MLLGASLFLYKYETCLSNRHMYFEASSSTDLHFNPNSDTLSVAIGQLLNLSGPRFPHMTKKKRT